MRLKGELMNNRHRIFACLKTCAIILLIFCLAASSSNAASAKLRSLSDFTGKKVAMLKGTSFESYLKENPVIRGNVEVVYKESDDESLAALMHQECDAIAMDGPTAELAVSMHDDLMVFPENIRNDMFGFGFPKGSEILKPFNTAMDKLKEEGLFDELKTKWMGKDELAKRLIEQDWAGKNGTLRYYVNVGTAPMAYHALNGDIVGYSVDLVLHVAREMDYKVEITEYPFDGLIPALQEGKCDLAGRAMSITPDRLEKINFSEPFYMGGSVLVVRKEDVDRSLISESDVVIEEKRSFWDWVKLVLPFLR